LLAPVITPVIFAVLLVIGTGFPFKVILSILFCKLGLSVLGIAPTSTAV